MADRYREWFEYGQSHGARWLLIAFDAHDLDWEPLYQFDEKRPERKSHGTWHVEHVIDLDRSMEDQRVDLAYMP